MDNLNHDNCHLRYPIIAGCSCDLWWDIPVTYNLTVNAVAVNTIGLPLSVEATCGRRLGCKGTEFGRQVVIVRLIFQGTKFC